LSIGERVADARLLWEHGRREGAFLNALVAVAAASRVKYPRSTEPNDRQAFVQFLTGALPVRLSVEFRGSLVPVEDLFYERFRCTLVHEGQLPADIEFMDGLADPAELAVRAGGAPEYVLGVSPSWFATLTKAALDGAAPVRVGP
jgi:hypothetical protein